MSRGYDGGDKVRPTEADRAAGKREFPKAQHAEGQPGRSFAIHSFSMPPTSSQQPQADSKCSSQKQPGKKANNGAFWAGHPNPSAPLGPSQEEGWAARPVCRTVREVPGAPPCPPQHGEAPTRAAAHPSNTTSTEFVKSLLPILAKTS